MLGCPTANVALDAAAIATLKPFSNHVMYGWGCIEAAGGADNGNSNNKGTRNGDTHDARPVAELGPWPVALSAGYNPHFQDVALTVEVHFLHDFAFDFYGSIVRIYVLGVVREQRCFDSLQALIDEIDRDKAHATRELRSAALCAHQHDRFVQPTAQLTAEEAAALPFVRLLDDNDSDDADTANKQATQSNGHTPAA